MAIQVAVDKTKTPEKKESSDMEGLSGLFAKDEKCIIFLDVMQALIDRTLLDAYTAAANLRGSEVTSSYIQFTPHIAERFRFALDLIPVWPANILDSEEQRGYRMCGQLQDCYRHLVKQYAEDIFQDEPETAIQLSIPGCAQFLHEVYKQLVQLPEVRSGLYFQLFGLHRKSVVVDAIRAALRNIVSRPGFSAPAPAPLPAIAQAPVLSSPGPSISQRPALPAPAPAPAPPQAPPSKKRTPLLEAPPSRRPLTNISAAFEKAAIEVDLRTPTLLAPPSRAPLSSAASPARPKASLMAPPSQAAPQTTIPPISQRKTPLCRTPKP